MGLQAFESHESAQKVGKIHKMQLFDGVPADKVDVNGVTILPGYLDTESQALMLKDLREVAKRAPFRTYETPGGRRMSVQMTAAGSVGWMTDRGGYRYATSHSEGSPWPDIPASVLNVWRDVSGVRREPDSCLLNFYGEGAKMGMHQDKDETELDWPVVSISLGDDALFRVGGLARADRTSSHWLKSGDIAVIGGTARLVYHGIDRIKFRSSALLPAGGRLNVTLRVAQSTN